LCSVRPTDDPQRYSSSRRPAVFHVVFDPSVPIALVAAPGRGPKGAPESEDLGASPALPTGGSEESSRT
jgi:hypothetical protein